MLELSDVSVNYGAIRALQGISLQVRAGQLVALLGANGAGKSTLLHVISGLARASSGKITFENNELNGIRAEKIVRRGIGHVPEGRGIFPDLTVKENLMIGAYTRRDRAGIAADYARMLAMFPSLARRERQDGSTLSGGEQQMLSLARTLMARPRLLLADELSLGLAPVITKQVFEHLLQLREHGITLLVVEQNANQVLKIADYVYVLKQGRIVLEGTPSDLGANAGLTQAYLGA